MTLVKLSEDGAIVLPIDARASLSLKTGDQLEVRIEGGGIRLVPATVDPVSSSSGDITRFIGTGSSFSSAREVDDFIRAERDRWD